MDEMLTCWKVFQCPHDRCPAHGRHDVCCWLVAGEHPRIDMGKSHLEPIEACLECEIFKNNAEKMQVEETLAFVTEQFRKYRLTIKDKLENETKALISVNERLKKEVEEHEAAEKACLNINEELNCFIRTVSHDLKAPIISIQGFSSRLLKTEGKYLREKGKKYLENIVNSADRMEALVLDLLQLSRVGETDCNIKKMSVGDIVAKVISSLEDRIRKHRIRIIVARDLPEITCDEGRIFQVFENLIVNAIKFTRGQKVPTIEIGYKSKERFYEFYVRDNGIGIAEKYHQEIFEMFRQLKEIDDAKGTGLGLTIVQRIVNRRGGKVWVESEKDKGATFYFTIPKE